MNKYVTMYNMILVHNSMYSHSSTPFHAAVPSVSRALAFGGVRARVRGRSRRPAGGRTRALARVRDREKSSRSVGVLEREDEDEGAFFQCIVSVGACLFWRERRRRPTATATGRDDADDDGGDGTRGGSGGGGGAGVGAEWIDAAGSGVGVGERRRRGVATGREEKVCRRGIRRRWVVARFVAVVNAGFDDGDGDDGSPGRWSGDAAEWVRERVAAERDAATDRFWVAHRL